MNLIIDIGNTTAKIAIFDQGEIIEVTRSSNEDLGCIEDICKRHPIRKGLFSTVITLCERVRKQLDSLPFPVTEFCHTTPIPVKNLYRTPNTLGMDRLGAVIGANFLKPGHDILVIDAGTCITYDFIDRNGQYHGGNISPGMNMRFKALHTFTNKLPQIEPKGEIEAYGKTTENAIRSGVIHGIEHEIMGYIHQLRKNYPTLLVFLTGGDDFSFDTNLKSLIFADSFLVLKGLNRILEYNDKI